MVTATDTNMKQRKNWKGDEAIYPQSVLPTMPPPNGASKIFPNNTTQGLSVQIHEPMGAFLTQTTLGLLFLNILKNLTLFSLLFLLYLFYSFYLFHDY